MAGSDSELEQQIVKTDHGTPSPGARAERVWAILREVAPELTDWDLVCFAANYLGWQSSNYLWLVSDAKAICKLVYAAHYLNEGVDVTANTREVDTVLQPSAGDTGSNTARKSESDSVGFTVEGGGFR